MFAESVGVTEYEITLESNVHNLRQQGLSCLDVSIYPYSLTTYDVSGQRSVTWPPLLTFLEPPLS